MEDTQAQDTQLDGWEDNTPEIGAIVVVQHLGTCTQGSTESRGMPDSKTALEWAMIQVEHAHGDPSRWMGMAPGITKVYSPGGPTVAFVMEV